MTASGTKIFSGIFKARCVAVKGDELTVYVPQVFGDTAITTTNVMDLYPNAGVFGYVTFEGGDPAFPIWVGTSAGPYYTSNIGPQGFQGNQGFQGDQGFQGNNGTPGADSASPSGLISPYAGLSAPSGWLFCDGSSVSRTTYANLWSALSVSKGTFTVTIAAPGVVTLTGHGLAEGDAVFFTTTGALPTGLSANTTYYVKYVGVNTFQLASTRTATASSGSAASFTTGTAITTTGSQSGTHTLYQAPYGIPSASSTNFYLPDMRGRSPIGLDNINGTDAGVLTIPNALGAKAGEETHQNVTAEMPSHTHTQDSHNHTQNSHNHTQDSHNHTQNSHTHTSGLYDGAGIGNNAIAAGGDYQGVIVVGGASSRLASNATTATNQAATATNQSATATNQSATATNQNTGGGNGHNNLHPFMLLNYIIKT